MNRHARLIDERPEEKDEGEDLHGKERVHVYIYRNIFSTHFILYLYI